MVTAVRDTAPTATTIRDVLQRVQGEYRDMPGLKLTEAQAQRFLGIDCDTCAVVLSTLIERRFLRRTENGLYVRAWDLRTRIGGFERRKATCPRRLFSGLS
jgi:hypothetical protein